LTNIQKGKEIDSGVARRKSKGKKTTHKVLILPLKFRKENPNNPIKSTRKLWHLSKQRKMNMWVQMNFNEPNTLLCKRSKFPFGFK
jgi:hypothetical protein